jgi:hypothetical protein
MPVERIVVSLWKGCYQPVDLGTSRVEILLGR